MERQVEPSFTCCDDVAAFSDYATLHEACERRDAKFFDEHIDPFLRLLDELYPMGSAFRDTYSFRARQWDEYDTIRVERDRETLFGHAVIVSIALSKEFDESMSSVFEKELSCARWNTGETTLSLSYDGSTGSDEPLYDFDEYMLAESEDDHDDEVWHACENDLGEATGQDLQEVIRAIKQAKKHLQREYKNSTI